jgi:hypothetical protein
MYQWNQAWLFPRQRTSNEVVSLKRKIDDLKLGNKIQGMETCKTTHYAASVHAQNGLVCMHDVEEQELFLSENYTLPQIANRM